MKSLIINPDYFKKAKEFFDLKTNFQLWDDYLKNKSDIPLEESLRIIREFGISIPRILFPKISYPITLYRARVIPKHSKENITDPKTFSYPPSKYAKYYQRANAPGFPVFYGALDGKTALEELRFNGVEPIKKGDTVFLSEWRIKDDAIFSLCYLTIPEIVKQDQLYSDLTKKIYSEIFKVFRDEDHFFSKTQRFLYERMSNLFLSGKYVQSGIIAHEILYNTPEVNGIKIHGIIYPSCSNDFRSVNCALHPDFVDDQLILESVRKLSFEEFIDGGAKGHTSYFGEVVKGKVHWQNYISELITSKFTIELALKSTWTDADIQASKFILHDHERDLKKYCSDKVNEIDLSKNRIHEKAEEYYRTKKMFYYVNDLKFDAGIGYLKTGDKMNEIEIIRIKIPLKAFTRRVSVTKVLM